MQNMFSMFSAHNVSYNFGNSENIFLQVPKPRTDYLLNAVLGIPELFFGMGLYPNIVSHYPLQALGRASMTYIRQWAPTRQTRKAVFKHFYCLYALMF